MSKGCDPASLLCDRSLLTEPSVKAYLKSRCDALEERIRAACQRAGRPREAITLVAVTVGSAAAILLLAIAALLIWRELEHRRRAAQALEAGKNYAESIVDTIREPPRRIRLSPEVGPCGSVWCTDS